MGEASIVGPKWRQVEVGRIVFIQDGEYSGKLAAIVEIIDHKRVCWHSIVGTAVGQMG